MYSRILYEYMYLRILYCKQQKCLEEIEIHILNNLIGFCLNRNGFSHIRQIAT